MSRQLERSAWRRTSTGDHAYTMHFSEEQLPPVDAFWSVTMYDAAGFQAANPINRFAIGDHPRKRQDIRNWAPPPVNRA